VYVQNLWGPICENRLLKGGDGKMKRIAKPEPDEYAPYTIMYIGLLPDDGLILKHLYTNMVGTTKFLRSLPNEKLIYRYAKGKWTIKEILAHLIDDERIYAYRALRFARNDRTELPGFEQDNYALESKANIRTIESLLKEFAAVRRSTIALFDSFDGEVFRTIRGRQWKCNERPRRGLSHSWARIAAHQYYQGALSHSVALSHTCSI
jgi:hypothetical protein